LTGYIDCSVTLRLENNGRIRDKVAEIKLKVPGAVLVASESQRSFEAAVDLLVDNLRRQLTRYKERQVRV
jgi:Ribosome-associated protein Y (PSrp-1)